MARSTLTTTLPLRRAPTDHEQEHLIARHEAIQRGGRAPMLRLHRALLALSENLPKTVKSWEDDKHYRVRLTRAVPADDHNHAMLRPMQDVVVRGDFARKLIDMYGPEIFNGAKQVEM